MLYLVSTPIGNLNDITFRALKTLKEVDEIICESTDIALKLLNHYGIKKPLIHLSEENQLEITPKVIQKLKNGKKLALISDAGTPTINDPGQFLVKQAIKEKIKISPIPGPSALLSSLIVSGFSTKPFIFLGFLPKNTSKKRKIFANIKKIKIDKNPPTIIFFESPNRLITSLETIKKVLGKETKVSIARELTKVYEEFIRGNINQVLEKLKKRQKILGEISVVVQ